MRRRGGGNKRRYRRIDFKRDKFGVSGKIAAVEYDPNRSAFISLVHYEDGEKRYILYVRGAGVGDPCRPARTLIYFPEMHFPWSASPSGPWSTMWR